MKQIIHERAIYSTVGALVVGLLLGLYLWLPSPAEGQGSNVSVTATVPTTLTCSTAGSPSAFGTLSTSAVSTSSQVTTTVSCNTDNGCTVNSSSTGDTSGGNAGLYKSTAPTDLIESVSSTATSTLSAGTDGYGLKAVTSTAGTGGVLGISNRFEEHSLEVIGGDTVGHVSTTAVLLASTTVPANGREISLQFRAAVGSLTRAGSYSDTIGITCVAN